MGHLKYTRTYSNTFLSALTAKFYYSNFFSNISQAIINHTDISPSIYTTKNDLPNKFFIEFNWLLATPHVVVPLNRDASYIPLLDSVQRWNKTLIAVRRRGSRQKVRFFVTIVRTGPSVTVGKQPCFGAMKKQCWSILSLFQRFAAVEFLTCYEKSASLKEIKVIL